MTIQLLQRIVNETQGLREESWNPDKAAYAKTQIAAAKETTARHGFPQFWKVVYLLNVECWNDAQELEEAP